MRSASLSMMLKTNLVYLFSVPASQSLWWTETKQKKKSNKFKDEFKIFHKLCSSQVKENLQYSQDFVASTILLDYIIIPVNSQKTVNKQSHILILPASREYLSIPSSVQLLPYLAQYITLQLSTRTTTYFGVWQVLIFSNLLLLQSSPIFQYHQDFTRIRIGSGKFQ